MPSPILIEMLEDGVFLRSDFRSDYVAKGLYGNCITPFLGITPVTLSRLKRSLREVEKKQE